MQRILLLGRLVREVTTEPYEKDGETREKAVFTLAVGEPGMDTQYFKCNVFGEKRVEFAVNRLKPGLRYLIIGKVWIYRKKKTDEEPGIEKTRILVQNIEFADGNKARAGEDQFQDITGYEELPFAEK